MSDALPQGARFAGDLLDSFPEEREPLIDGICRVGETVNFIAAPKANKSWTAMDTALSIAAGRPWLGRFDVRQGNVLILDNELHPETSAFRLRAIAQKRGIQRKSFRDRLIIHNLRGAESLCVGKLLEHLHKFRSVKLDLVVIDAWYRVLPEDGSESDNSLVRNAYAELDRCAHALGCAFLCVHHTSKGAQAGRSITDVGAGAGAQSRAADAHLILRPHRDGSCAVLDGVTRSFPPIRPIGLRWDECVWTYDPTIDPRHLQTPATSKDLRQAQADADTDAAVLKVLRQASGPLTSRRIGTLTSFSTTRINRSLARLAEQIVRTSDVRRGQEVSTYTIAS